MKSLPPTDINQLCSSQVVIDLAISVKELLENSLDAKATNISVSIKDLDIECIDNGSGISAIDWPLLCEKYCTSKLSSFHDLPNVKSFGFRGEALSSLCNVCKQLTVTTRTSDMDHAYRLFFSSAGKLVKTEPASRNIGTTVSIIGLFHSLPVRQREFKSKIKSEIVKMTAILASYAIINPGVKISCHDLKRCEPSPDFRKSRLLACTGKSIVQSIAEVYGTKQVENSVSVQSMSISLPDKPDLRAFSICGFISRPGQGRTTADRQIWSLNKRPCLLPKWSRAVTQVYRDFSPQHQFPFFVLNISAESGFDLNVTPDKRTLLIEMEDRLILVLRDKLDEFFEPFRGVIPSCAQSGESSTERGSRQSTLDRILLIDDDKVARTVDSPPVTRTRDLSDDSIVEKTSKVHRVGIEVTHEILPLRFISVKRATELWNEDLVLDVCMPEFAKVPRDNYLDRSGNVSRFRSRVGDSADDVEREFNARLSKKDFSCFKVLGQFNLGFIIVSLEHDSLESRDLFIIDQELVVEENRDLLFSMGFDLRIDMTQPVTSRVRILSLPQTGKLSFTVHDVEEIIDKLGQGDRALGKVYCSKLLRMFASKACRSSVMIGTSLTHAKMTEIVERMSKLEQPWNCPHGRPTIRHLAVV